MKKRRSVWIAAAVLLALVLGMAIYAGDYYRANLPESTIEVVIDGGNHAQFGSYGTQKGDGEAAVTREAQQAFALQCLLELIFY